MKTILVTGGAGFIGSNFVRHLWESDPDAHVIVADALTYAGRLANLTDGAHEPERFEFAHGDVRDVEFVDGLVDRADVVVHFAAESHVTRSIRDDRLFFETGVVGTQTVASAVAARPESVDRFVHISTSEVYGTAVTETMDEEHPLRPLSPYASAKCGADRLVHSYWSTYGVPAVIVRPFNTYGPRQHLEKVIPRFVTGCLRGEPLTVHGDGSATRDFVHVDDLCRALGAILEAEAGEVLGEVFNVGSGVERSILELAEAVLETAGTPDVGIRFIGDRPGQVRRHACDFGKATRALGWEPRVSPAEGLERTFRWYRDNEDWWRDQISMRAVPIVAASGRQELH